MTLEEQLNSKEKMYKDSYLFKRLYSYLKPELAIFILDYLSIYWQLLSILLNHVLWV